MTNLTEWRRQCIESQMRSYARRSEPPSVWPRRGERIVVFLLLAFVAFAILWGIGVVSLAVGP